MNSFIPVRRAGCQAISQLLLLAICAASTDQTVRAESQVVDVTYADLRAGYWLNYEEFKTLFVAWRHVTLPLDAALRHQEEMWKSETPEQRAALRKANGHLEEQNEFWTDRTAFQVRTPSTHVADRDSPERTFDFPLGPARKANLMTDFKEIGIYNYNGNQADGVKRWNGVLQSVPQAAIVTQLTAMSPGKWLPPLAMREPVAGFEMHPFDAFFKETYDSARVVERTTLNGRDVYLVETVKSLPQQAKRMRAIVEYDGGDVEKLLVQEVERAWIDMERGCLPLRMEVFTQWIYDGRTYFDPGRFGPKLVAETQQIEQIPQGGFYPTHVRRLQNVLDPIARASLPAGAYTLTKIIRGDGPKIPVVPYGERRWVAHAVDAGRDMTGLFGFEFPDGTVYYDFRTSKVVGRTYDDATGKPGFAPRRGRGTGSITRWVLIGFNVALVIGLAALVVIRRVKGLRG